MTNICFLLILIRESFVKRSIARRASPTHHIHNQQFFNILSSWIIHATSAFSFVVLRYQIIWFSFRFFNVNQRMYDGKSKKGFCDSVWYRTTTKARAGIEFADVIYVILCSDVRQKSANKYWWASETTMSINTTKLIPRMIQMTQDFDRWGRVCGYPREFDCARHWWRSECTTSCWCILVA